MHICIHQFVIWLHINTWDVGYGVYMTLLLTISLLLSCSVSCLRQTSPDSAPFISVIGAIAAASLAL